MCQGSYRAAVIGHTGQGNYGHGLDLAFYGLPNVRIVAVADPDEAGRQQALARTGAPAGYADYHELVERERPDVVAVATRWPDQHEAMITAAVRAGARGILSEKPLAGALDVADRILDLCDTGGVKVAVAHQNRGRGAPAFVKRLIDQGKIGRLRAIRTYGKQDGRSGGEDLLVLGTHLLDLTRLFAGAAIQGQPDWGGEARSGDAHWCDARITVDGRDATPADIGTSRTERLGPLAGDAIFAMYGMDGGVVATFESARADDGGGNDYFHIELCGTAGILAFWSDPGTPVYFTPRPYALPGGAEWERIEPPPEPKGENAPPGAGSFFASNQVIARDLLCAIEEDRRPIAGGHDARAALEMILATYESHIAGGRVTLPLANRTHPLTRWT